MRNFTFFLLNKVKIESHLFALKTSLQVAEMIKFYSMFRKVISDLSALFSWQAYEKTYEAFFLSLRLLMTEKCRATYKSSIE